MTEKNESVEQLLRIAAAYDHEEQYKDELRKLLGPRHLGKHILKAAVDEIRSLRAFKASVDEALNQGDGSYKP